MTRRIPFREGKERRKGVNVLHLVNTALMAGIFLYVQHAEHRLTAVETKVDILISASGLETPDFIRNKKKQEKENGEN